MTNIELNAMTVKASRLTREMSNGGGRMSNLFVGRTLLSALV